MREFAMFCTVSLLGVVGVVAVPEVTELSVAERAPRAESSGTPAPGNPCIPAEDVRAYVLCEALKNQPGFTTMDRNGNPLTVPSGLELITWLSSDGATPAHNTRLFRRAARAFLGGYFSERVSSTRLH